MPPPNLRTPQTPVCKPAARENGMLEPPSSQNGGRRMPISTHPKIVVLACDLRRHTHADGPAVVQADSSMGLGKHLSNPLSNEPLLTVAYSSHLATGPLGAGLLESAGSKSLEKEKGAASRDFRLSASLVLAAPFVQTACNHGTHFPERQRYPQTHATFLGNLLGRGPLEGKLISLYIHICT